MTKCEKYYIIVLVIFTAMQSGVPERKMNRKSAAVLDVRSSAVTALVGERGVNNTFVFRGVRTEEYDGYADAEFFDLQGLQRAVYAALEGVEHACGGSIRELWVGVPGEFVRVVPKRCFMSFQSKRRVTSFDIDNLFKNGFTPEEGGYTLIRRSAVCYYTSDKRRTIDPVGMISDSLEGYLSYFFADGRFLDIFRNMLSEYGVRKVYFLPSSLAEALYLIPSETRDEYAILLDVDTMSMTFSVVCGNGIVYQNACSVGGGHVTAQLYRDGDVDIPFDVARAMIGKINLSGKDAGDAVVECVDKLRTYTLPVQFLKERVKDGLDMLCEVVSKCLELCGDRNIDYKPVLLTGGGITGIRGMREHLSGRLDKVVEIVAPALPYYNKPAQSSLLSLLHMALLDKREKSFFHKFFNGIGG